MVDGINSMDDSDIRDNARLADEGDAGATSDLTEHAAGTVGQEPQDIRVDAEAPQKAEDPYEGAVPPGYDWPTHGGYLGCLMGVMAATIAALLLTAPVLYFADIPLGIVWLLRVVIFLACIIGGGRLGWALGKRFYREYPHDRPTWGESDDAEVEGVEVENTTREEKTSETNART